MRAGRVALQEHDFERAEARFVSALEAATRFRSRDVRVAASFGNVVRVASIYERVGRSEDAERVMDTLEAIARRRRDGARWTAEARTRYSAMVLRPLSARLVPDDMPRPPASASYDRLIRATAAAYELDPALVKAVVAAESNFERRAVSRVGAQGLMQLMPETARDLGVRRPFTPSENLRGGVQYLRSLLDRFEDLDLALAAYNAGPEAVVRYGGIPPYPETEDYVSRVRRHYRRYQTSFAR
jgi:soluble lytic murein transglycosylase-like protein